MTRILRTSNFPAPLALGHRKLFLAKDHEAYVSTQYCKAQTQPRLPRSHAYGRRPRCHPRAPRQGPGSTGCIRQAVISPRGLPRHQRIPDAPAFQAVLKHGRRSRDACFAIYAAPATGGVARLGVAVSRRVSRSAVGRNRIKRQIRESFRQHKHELGAQDIVVVAQSRAATETNASLRSSLERHWDQLKKCAAS